MDFKMSHHPLEILGAHNLMLESFTGLFCCIAALHAAVSFLEFSHILPMNHVAIAISTHVILCLRPTTCVSFASSFNSPVSCWVKQLGLGLRQSNPKARPMYYSIDL